MTSELENTLSIDDRSSDDVGANDTPRLILALECDRPLASSEQIILSSLEEVTIGRGEQRVVERGARSVVLRVPDRRMSTTHARLIKFRDQWALEDADSKNGCVVNGEKRQRVVLADGDLIELGHTLLVFRRRGQVEVSASDIDQSNPPAIGLATFLPELAKSFKSLIKIARSEVAVILLGESGTGKEVLARAIHKLSGRPGDFVAVNCGALPDNLLEAELFGHRRGAFSGAVEDRPGLVRAADKGTLFLDEIGDMPPQSQAALLRVLQEREVVPVGETRPVKVDIRVLAATHHDLEALTRRDRFRSDLLARISGLTVNLPPLRERREDMGLLVSELIRRVAPQPETVRFRRAAARALFRYNWPLNIRELEKCLGTAAVLADGDRIAVEHLPPMVRAAVDQNARAEDSGPPELSAADNERREELHQLLAQHEGNISAVARIMGKTRTQIHRWIKRYRLDLENYRA